MRTFTLRLAVGLALAGLIAAAHSGGGGALHQALMRLHGG